MTKYLDHSYEKMWEEVKKEFPRAKIVNKKDSLFMKIIFKPLEWVTGNDYINNYVTTIFQTVYVPDSWFNDKDYSDYRKFAVIRHEREHLRQFRCFPFGKHFWFINPFIMSLFYILILPVFFTFRAHFEKQAYKHNMLTYYETHNTINYTYWEKKLYPIFCGNRYFWMDNSRWFKKWLSKTIKEIEKIN